MASLYQVEQIIGKKITNKGKVEYRVKWKGYQQNEATWQPEENLIYVKEMIQDYESNHNPDNQKSNKEADNEQFLQKQKQIQQLQFGQNFEQENQNREANEENKNKNDGFIQYQEKDMPNNKKTQQNQSQIENQQKSSQSVFQIDDSQNDALKPPKKKKGRKPKKTSKIRTDNFINSKFDMMESKKDSKTDENKMVSQHNSHDKSFKSTLQTIQSKMRFLQKNKDKSLQKRKDFSKITPTVIGINYKTSNDKQIMYLTQVQGLISYKTREYMIENWADQLLRFYETKINYTEIPKLSI